MEIKDIGPISLHLDATFISLPKKPRAIEIKDFGPVSLITWVYKILVQVLANKLNMVLDMWCQNSKMPL